MVGSIYQASLSAAALSLVWAAAIRSLTDIIGKQNENQDFRSGGRAFYKHSLDLGKELASGINSHDSISKLR
jgi:hypothetical protein